MFTRSQCGLSPTWSITWFYLVAWLGISCKLWVMRKLSHHRQIAAMQKNFARSLRSLEGQTQANSQQAEAGQQVPACHLRAA